MYLSSTHTLTLTPVDKLCLHWLNAHGFVLSNNGRSITITSDDLAMLQSDAATALAATEDDFHTEHEQALECFGLRRIKIDSAEYDELLNVEELEAAWPRSSDGRNIDYCTVRLKD